MKRRTLIKSMLAGLGGALISWGRTSNNIEESLGGEWVKAKPLGSVMSFKDSPFDIKDLNPLKVGFEADFKGFRTLEYGHIYIHIREFHKRTRYRTVNGEVVYEVLV